MYNAKRYSNLPCGKLLIEKRRMVMSEHLVISRYGHNINGTVWSVTTDNDGETEKNLLVTTNKIEALEKAILRAKTTNATISVFSDNGRWLYSQRYQSGALVEQTDNEGKS